MIMNKKVINGIAITVVAVWAISMIVEIFNPAYNPPNGIYPALMIVLGSIFGYTLVRRPPGD